MSGDLPSDVHAVLTQLLDETETAVTTGALGTARLTITTAETVCRNKLPEGDLRSQMLHGCGRVTVALEPTDGVDTEMAAEYCRAMSRRLRGR